MDEHDLWHEIFSTTDETEALVLKGLLESEGIECHIVSCKVPQFPVNVDGLGLIKLKVAKEDIEKALSVLSGK